MKLTKLAASVFAIASIVLSAGIASAQTAGTAITSVLGLPLVQPVADKETMKHKLVAISKDVTPFPRHLFHCGVLCCMVVMLPQLCP